MLLYKGRKIFPEKFLSCGSVKNFKFSDYTTYGLGGGARGAYFPDNLPKAERVYDEVSRGRFAIIGNGSDVLASDKFFDGEVICTKKLKGIINCGNGRLLCLGGTTVGELLSYCRRKGFGGLEYLAGIPATVGGLAYMNGGACGRYIGEDIEKVCIYNGSRVLLNNKQCNFAYKHSTMRGINCLILFVLLKIYPSTSAGVKDEILKILRKRSSLPKGRSCGCVFKNIGGVSAGKLIEGANLKGKRRGGAFVSPLHANFIINSGGSARDVFDLIGVVKEKVYKVFGTELEEEVVYIGDFNETNG